MEVQVHDGSVYSGIFHAISEGDYGMLRKYSWIWLLIKASLYGVRPILNPAVMKCPFTLFRWYRCYSENGILS